MRNDGMSECKETNLEIRTIRNPINRSLGDYSGRVPPLPIPNREVKPASADGTANCGRVGRRRL